MENNEPVDLLDDSSDKNDSGAAEGEKVSYQY